MSRSFARRPITVSDPCTAARARNSAMTCSGCRIFDRSWMSRDTSRVIYELSQVLRVRSGSSCISGIEPRAMMST